MKLLVLCLDHSCSRCGLRFQRLKLCAQRWRLQSGSGRHKVAPHSAVDHGLPVGLRRFRDDEHRASEEPFRKSCLSAAAIPTRRASSAGEGATDASAAETPLSLQG